MWAADLSLVGLSPEETVVFVETLLSALPFIPRLKSGIGFFSGALEELAEANLRGSLQQSRFGRIQPGCRHSHIVPSARHSATGFGTGLAFLT